MDIISNVNYDMATFGKLTTCNVHCIHLKIKNIKKKAQEMVDSISNTSWIYKLGAIEKLTFEARANKTIDKLANNIFKKIKNKVTEEFGEYLISDTAQVVLESECLHTKVPLAELLKEKIIGNPGFDFHTESKLENIVFGEAKYSGKSTPRAKALNQIAEFIDESKDHSELILLTSFVSKNAMKNATKNKKSFAAAFSYNGKKPDLMFKQALKSSVIDKLILHQELYIIAVEI